jgi:hypothetical protein
LVRGGEGVDVVEDVGGFGDAEGGAGGVRKGLRGGERGLPHFGEHVGLGFAWVLVSGRYGNLMSD